MSIYTINCLDQSNQTVSLFLDSDCNRLYDEDDIDLIPHESSQLLNSSRIINIVLFPDFDYNTDLINDIVQLIPSDINSVIISGHNDDPLNHVEFLDHLTSALSQYSIELYTNGILISDHIIDLLCKNKIKTTILYDMSNDILKDSGVCKHIQDLYLRLVESFNYDDMSALKFKIIYSTISPIDVIAHIQDKLNINITCIGEPSRTNIDHDSDYKSQFMQHIITSGLYREYSVPSSVQQDIVTLLNNFKYNTCNDITDFVDKVINVNKDIQVVDLQSINANDLTKNMSNHNIQLDSYEYLYIISILCAGIIRYAGLIPYKIIGHHTNINIPNPDWKLLSSN